jgi:hypothetical protein
VTPASLDFSGNYLNLYPPFDESGDAPGAAVWVQSCSTANVCGNTLGSGGHGFLYDINCGSALILANNFSNATYRGIGYLVNNASLQTASVFNNIIGQGVSFHAQLQYSNSFGWFLNQNTYLDAAGNSVPAFCDPASSAAHITY